MKSLVAACLVLGAACSGDPERQDLDLFCGPDATAQGKTLPVIGEYVLAHAHPGTFVASTFALAKQGSITPADLARSLAVQLDAAHITDCPTYTTLWGFRPHPH